ncbi:hypothetical protein GXW82_06560 [Streptacidiphilus sp. 4-A2]|nr:hypothetical protein [Streptacidiphilus sp. 4-A2]
MTTPTATTYTSLLQVTIEGAPLPDALATLMAEGWVDSGVNIPSAFQLTFNDPAREITTNYPQVKIGAKVVLTPILDGKPSLLPLLTGEITALEADADATTKLLVVRGYDPGHRMLRNCRVVGYPTMTASEIVTKVAALCEVEIGEVEPTTTVYELATQPNISDWDFLNRLARENGMRLYVDQLGLLQFKKLPRRSGSRTRSPRCRART